MPISKPFVVATEGRTIDGRNLPREWLIEAAENYDPASYTAVVNLEHFIAMSPDSDFSSHGKVISLTTRSAKILGEEKLQLVATVEASEAAAKLQVGGKKCFASVEILPNFAGSGKAYLTGIALTDTPAALGTQPMKFSTFSEGAGQEHLALAQETSLEFKKAKKLAKKKELAAPREDMPHAQLRASFEELAAAQQKLAKKGSEAAASVILLKADLALVQAAHKTLQAEFAALKEELAKLDASGATRPLATGGNNTVKTDC